MKVCKVTLIILFLFVLMSAVSAADDLNSTEDVILSDSSEEVILSDGGDVENHSVIYADADNGNDSNDGLSKNSPVKTINKAYDLVDDGGTIYLADGVYNRTNSLYIYKSLSIIGSNNTVIDGGSKIIYNPSFRTMGGSYLLFKNIKFQNINTYGTMAKVIYASAKDSILILDNCDFINNTLSEGDLDNGPSPVISISSSVTAHILNCNFIGKFYYKFNNAIEKDANSWVIKNWAKLTINNTKFMNVSDGFIFAEKIDRRVNSLNINNCTFINSLGKNAIYCKSILNINNSSFINCSNGGSGGAVYIDKGSNKKINPIITNCYFENCYSSSNGGAIAVYNANSFDLLNSSFVGCSCLEEVGGFGGALYVSKNTNAYLNHNIFSECSGKGAAIYNGGNTILNNSIIKNSKICVVTNMYGYYLGSILNDYGTLTVISTIFENNTCFKTWYNRGTHIGTAGIYNRGTLDVSYSAFINNKIISQNFRVIQL